MPANWFQGLGELWLFLGGIATGCGNLFASWAAWSSDMPVLNRLGFSAVVLILGLEIAPVAAAVTWYAVAWYTVWIEFDRQINVRWPRGIFCYGHDQVKRVEILHERYWLASFSLSRP